MNYKNREEIIERIDERKQRIKDLIELGDEACSDYDLMFGYDANFYLNVCPLPANHILSYTRDLNEWDIKHKTPGAQITLF